MIEPVLLVPAVAGAFGTTTVGAWLRARRERHQEEAVEEYFRSAPLPTGAFEIYTHDTARQIPRDLAGSLMIVDIGTFALNDTRRFLSLLHLTGLEGIVGSILAVENDAEERRKFWEGIPAVFHDRVVFGFSKAYSGGAHNRPINETLHDVDIWGVPIDEAAEATIELHLRRQQCRAPGLILVPYSLGGQAPMGLVALDALSRRFVECLIVAATALPRHRRLRERFSYVKRECEAHGVKIWLLADNLAEDPVTCDAARAVAIVGLHEAALHADSPTQPNNALALASKEGVGGIVAFQVAQSRPPAYPFRPIPDGPIRCYHAPKDGVVEHTQRLLHTLEEGRGIWSTGPVPLMQTGKSTFDVVSLAVAPEDVVEVQDGVARGRQLQARFGVNGRTNGHVSLVPSVVQRADYETIFACMATVIDPDHPAFPIVAVRLAALEDRGNLVQELIKPPQERTSGKTQQHRRGSRRKRKAQLVALDEHRDRARSKNGGAQ